MRMLSNHEEQRKFKDKLTRMKRMLPKISVKQDQHV